MELIMEDHIMITRRSFISVSGAALLSGLGRKNTEAFVGSEGVVDVLSTASALGRGMVSFTFDDGYVSLFKSVYPLARKYKIPVTAYVVTGPRYWGIPGYATKDHLWTMHNSGLVEIGNHTRDHLHWASLTDAQILADIQACQNDLLRLGIIGQGSFTPPFGDPYDYLAYPGLYGRMVRLLTQAGFPTSSRVPWDDTDQFNEVGTFDRWKINSVQLVNPKTLADVKPLIDEAVAAKKWLAFTSHDVRSSNELGGVLNTAVLEAVMQYVATLRTQGKILVVPVSKGVGQMLHYQNLP